MIPAGVENVVALAAGVDATPAGAYVAASGALLAVIAAAGSGGRQEYRLTVAGAVMIVTPGLTAEGMPDVEDLQQSLEAWPVRA